MIESSYHPCFDISQARQKGGLPPLLRVPFHVLQPGMPLFVTWSGWFFFQISSTSTGKRS